MAKILPFKAVRPTRDKVSLIASRPYQSYTKIQRETRMDNNPFSFLHIVNPGYRYNKETTGEERFQLVRNRYEEFKEEGIFIQDSKPSYYLYKIVNRDREQFTGFIAATSIEDYENNIIRKHEDTIEHRVIVFKDYLKTVGFNAEPVLMTYPPNKVLSAIIEETLLSRSEYEFTTTYRDTHYLWKISDDKTVSKIKSAFSEIETCYIADGHHRSSSSQLLAEEMRSKNPKHTGTEAYNFFMGYFIPENELLIQEFNRVVRDLNGLTKEEFLIALDTHYRIENRNHEIYKPSKKHHFSMYLDGEYYSLYLRRNAYKFDSSLSKLDAQILYKTILEPILGIHDLRNNDRIDYLAGRKDLSYVKDLVDRKKFAVGFGMLPVTIEEMKQIADDGFKMPPKSTYIEPKLRNGISIYEF